MKQLLILLVSTILPHLLIAQDAVWKKYDSYATIDSLAHFYYEEGALEKALSGVLFLEQAAKKDFGAEDSVYAHYANMLGYYYELSEDYSRSMKYYQAAHHAYISSHSTNHLAYATLLMNLGHIYLEFKNFEKAEESFLKALQLNKQLTGELSDSYSITIGGVGHLYEAIGEYEKAEAYYIKGLELDKELLGQGSVDYSYSLNNLGVLYYKMQKLEEAEPLLLQAKDIRKKELGNQHLDYAASLNNLGALYQDMNRIPKAILSYKESLKIIDNQLGKKHSWYAVILNNLADLYFAKGNYETAKKLNEESLSIRKKLYGVEHPTYGKALNNVALCYLNLRDYEQAENLLKTAQEITYNSFGEAHEEYLLVLNNYSTLLEKQGAIKEAIQLVFSGMAANTSNFKSIYPTCFKSTETPLFLPQNMTYDLNEVDWKKLEKIDPIYPKLMLTSLDKLLRLKQIQLQKLPSNSDSAQQINKQLFDMSYSAMQVSEKIRQGFSSKTDKLRFLKGHTFYVEHGIMAASTLNQANYLNQAFSFAEQNKSILLEEAIKGNRAHAFGDLPKKLVLKELELQEQKAELNKAQHEARTKKEKEVLLAQENQLNQTLNQFLKSLKEKYPKYHALKYENINAQAKEIQGMLDDKTMLLEFFNTDSVIYLFALTKNHLGLFPLEVSQKTLRKKVGNLRKTLSDYEFIFNNKNKAYQSFVQEAAWFYETLLKKALQGKNMRNLMIVSDGELGHLPFEVFLVERPMQKEINYHDLYYLCKDYNISYNYSATLWKENKKMKQKENNGKILACASFYPEQDETSKGKHATTQEAFRPPHIIKLRKTLIPLPAAKEEVKSLSNFLNGTFLTGKEVNETFFKKNAARYGVIHLAMHGLLNPHMPMLSSLAFTETYDSLQDDFLQAYEISHLKLHADLVVLSACETGYGKFEQGEGIISLARSFMYAGVPALVVSLWKVNDASTAWIMHNFYENLVAGMTKDESLRQAKLNYLAVVDGVAAHPVFWSAFIQLGDTAPLSLKSQSTWWRYGIGGSLLLLLVIFSYKPLKGRIEKDNKI